jgi:Xaa-Pro aminopeptidase
MPAPASTRTASGADSEEKQMTRGAERVARIEDALQDARLDALVCTLPANVLLLSGYWPVVGSAVAVATRDGPIAVLAPEDEQELA